MTIPALVNSAFVFHLRYQPGKQFNLPPAAKDFGVSHTIPLDVISKNDIALFMKAKHTKTLDLIFSRPISGNVRWSDVEALLIALGAEIVEAAGSRVRVFLFNEVRVFHRPHPSPTMDKGAVGSLRDWLEANGVTP